MKKIRKGKKMLIILLSLIIIVIAAIIIGNILKKQPVQTEKPQEVPQIIELPETVYSNMEVRNVAMEYLKENNQTEITMQIVNTTGNKVEGGHFEVMWIGPDENVLGQIIAYIQDLDIGQAHKVSVILKGDLTATTQIKLVKE